MFRLFFGRPCRLSGRRVMPSYGTLKRVTITILQGTGSKLSGDIFKNISEQRKIFRALEIYL